MLARASLVGDTAQCTTHTTFHKTDTQYHLPLSKCSPSHPTPSHHIQTLYSH